jgi:hypothetical protein
MLLLTFSGSSSAYAEVASADRSSYDEAASAGGLYWIILNLDKRDFFIYTIDNEYQ